MQQAPAAEMPQKMPSSAASRRAIVFGVGLRRPYSSRSTSACR